MHYYECFFKATDELVANGWTVNEDGWLDQTFYCKTKEPLLGLENAKRHLAREFAPNDRCNVNLVNCLDTETVENLALVFEVSPDEFESGCGIPA